jgi:crotonobetainyl-CoA:carnitine CoA-transferase CaiB-like acyl-CoA transferase
VTGALEGLRVLDLTRYLPGPYATMLLGDLGADVVKIEEPPIGDPTRGIPPEVGEDSAVHAALNRNKRSVLVDLRDENGAAVVKALARRADVLVETYRPGVLARRGLGAAALLAENPRLVYCALSGYGQDGPRAQAAGHDIDYMARGGFLATTRDAGGRPVLPLTHVGDMAGALTAVIGILAALQARERTSRGQVVDASMLDGVLALMTVPIARLSAGGRPESELSGTHACYNVYRCRDGRYLAVGALEPKFWEALCRALGHEDRAKSQWAGGDEQLELVAAFERTFATRDCDEWIRALAPIDACVEPVLDLHEAIVQEQARPVIWSQPSGSASFGTVGAPFRLSQTPPALRRPAPRPGQHTDEVLGELGYATAEIARLRDEGAVA